jgi:hypothetical protein
MILTGRVDHLPPDPVEFQSNRNRSDGNLLSVQRPPDP